METRPALQEPLVSFYGDDFTGSSENLAQFYRNGLKARLYFSPPSELELAEAVRGLHVFGIAGAARSMGLEAMDAELDVAFAALAKVGGNLIQYKLCSTFDSSPTTGSFGKAIEVAKRHFPSASFPMLPATPDFGRYTAFGNHFARYADQIYRLDRHPSMSRHPSTPMLESDLMRHLALQTDHPFQSIMLPAIRARTGLENTVEGAFAAGRGAIFDSVDNDDLDIVCDALLKASDVRTLFALAAQGFAQRLGARLADRLPAEDLARVETTITPVERLVVLSGSCALQNARQIAAAEEAGWGTFRADAARIAAGDPDLLEELFEQAAPMLQENRSVVIFTARGAEDAAQNEQVSPKTVGGLFANLLDRLASATPIRRAVLAGGDSSSYTVKLTNADYLDIAVFDEKQNSHVCTLHGGTSVDGLEVMLKGGQVGRDDFFLRARTGD